MRALQTISFIYDMREDRVLALVNIGGPEAWACWLTRRVATVLLERAANLIASTSTLAQRSPAANSSNVVSFGRDAANTNTADNTSEVPLDALRTIGPTAALVGQMTISRQGASFGLELQEKGGDGVAAVLDRDELQRILDKLETVAVQANWLSAVVKARAMSENEETESAAAAR